MIGGGPAVNDGEVFFFDSAGFPAAAEFAGGGGVFGNDNHAAGFAVEAVYKVRGGAGQVQAGAADEAGVFIAFRRMANEVGGFVNEQQIRVFVNDFKKFFQARRICHARARKRSFNCGGGGETRLDFSGKFSILQGHERGENDSSGGKNPGD